MTGMNETNQAILLLTVRFGASKADGIAPLGPAEYGQLASWLHRKDHEPSELLHHPEEVLFGWSDPTGRITTDRIKGLLNRGMAMGISLEKWLGSGLWILTRADSDYPDSLRKHLGQGAPSVLFGAGNRSLLHVGGLAMVGTRNITEEDRLFGEMIAKQAASEGFNVVSGGARGIDDIAMRSALEVEGTALAILSCGLLRASLAKRWRTAIRRDRLCLVSTFYPEAGFQIGNAMARNKYIYCLSDVALVVQSAKGEGGTWAGATENLKHQWAKLFVRSESQSDGLEALIGLGAMPLSIPSDSSRTGEWLRALLTARQPAKAGSSTESGQLPLDLYP